MTRANSAHSHAAPLKRCSDNRTAGTPITVSGSACSGDSTIQPNTVTVVPSTISGANSSVSEKKPAPHTIANDATPSGNLSATKTRPFQVIGSRSQRRTRCTGDSPRWSGGVAIGTAEHRAREAALDRGHPAPGGERGEQDSEPDDHHRQCDADRDTGDEDREVGEAQREREQQVNQVHPRLRTDDDAGEAGEPGAHASQASPAPLRVATAVRHGAWGQPHRVEDVREAARGRPPVEAGLGACAGGGGGAGIVEHAPQSSRGVGGIAWRVEPSSSAAQDLRRPAGGGGDDRPARGQRLHDRQPVRLAIGAVEEDMGALEGGPRVAQRPREGDAAGEVGARGAPAQAVDEVGRVAGQRRARELELEPGHARGDLEREVGPLPRDEGAEHERPRQRRRRGIHAPTLEVHSGVDHVGSRVDRVRRSWPRRTTVASQRPVAKRTARASTGPVGRS